MLIRISQSVVGIEHYFETGKKRGREATRHELDQRVHLSGDLQSFAATTAYSRKNKSWKNHYWHITASFAIENNNLDDETLRAINDEMMAYYFAGYDLDSVSHAAEAHRPKIQSVFNEMTGKYEQRLLHLHNAIAKFDHTTGNQIRMTPFNQSADRAFQTYLCQKYGLVDPVDRIRDVPKTKKDMISRFKSYSNASKQTKVAELRKLFSELVNDAESLEQVKSILLETGLVGSVIFKSQKSGNKYLQVQTTLGTRNINLRGKGFDKLEKLYYSSDEIEKRVTAGKYSEAQKKNTPKENRAIFESHRDWWLDELKKREPKNKNLLINHEKSRKKLESYYEKYTREQRRYFVIYRNNIREESIRGYRIFERANERYLVNSNLGVKIFDRPNKITLQLPNDSKKRKQAVALALSIAQDKGWDLKAISVTGSIGFRTEIKRQIDQIIEEKGSKKDTWIDQNISVTSSPKVPKEKPKVLLNAVSQALYYLKEKQVERLSKDRLAAIKNHLDAQSVIDYAVQKYGLLSEYFAVAADNKIHDARTKARPKSVIDFLSKTCNLPIADTMRELDQLYAQQLEASGISVCDSDFSESNTTKTSRSEGAEPKM